MVGIYYRIFSQSLWLLTIAIITSMLVALPASANFNDGVEAFKKKDYEATYRFFKPLADQQDPKAQFGLGLLYRNGLGVRRDLRKAYDYYKAASEQGYAKAQYNLGILILYLAKNNDKFDAQNAVAWLKLAAQQDVARAQYHLGMFYWNGQHGLEYDRVAAYMWITLSASNFYQQAATQLKSMKKNMSASEIQIAKKLAAQWRPVKPEQIKDPLQAANVQSNCQTLDNRLNIEISDITKRTKEFLICLYKKDFYDDCKTPHLQLTAIYNYHRETLERDWWACQ